MEWYTAYDHGNYEVTKCGKLRNRKTKYAFKLNPNSSGYVHVLVRNNKGKKGTVTLHYLICSTFHGPKPEKGYTVDHINRMRADNRSVNLRWATRSEQALNQSRKKVLNKGFYIVQKDPENGKVVKEYINAQHAGNVWKLTSAAILQAIYLKRLCKGFMWEFKKVENLEEETWKSVKRNEKEIFISSSGRTKDKQDRLLKQYVSTSGYFSLSFRQKHFYVHRLMAETFHPNLSKLRYVNHIDGNKLNNKASNLEWCTQQHNSKHAWEIGLNKAVNERKVYKVNGKTMKVEKEYKSISVACQTSGQSHPSLGSMIKRGFVQKDGTIWSFTKTPEVKKPYYMKKVYKICIQTGKILKVYETVKKASQKEGIIHHTLNNRIRNQSILENVLFTHNKDVDVSNFKSLTQRTVRKIDVKTGKVVKEYTTVTEAGKSIGKSPQSFNLFLQRKAVFEGFKYLKV